MMKGNNLDFWDFDTKEIKMESYRRFSKSIFNNVFEKALLSVEEIIDHIEEGDNDKEVNNIIAFTGERGTGKTTAMVSFVKYLQKDIADDKEWKPNSPARKYNFQCIPLIDPSKLTLDENMITLVVAYIYENIKRIARDEIGYDKKNTNSIKEKLKNGIHKCQEIYNVVCVKYTSFSQNIEQNPDTVETFSEIAKATRIRELIQELVDIYLDILSGESSKKSILIIQIDDLDTNIKNAYTLAEDLRSYFMISKVIIMMAVKLEQLNDVIQLKFCEDLKNLSNEGSWMDSGTATMAAKYLEKLIPYDRRIEMPSLTFQNLGDYNITIKISPNKTTKRSTWAAEFLINGQDSHMEEESQSLVEYVLRLLHQKSGIILVKNEENSHEFIPCNLRTLHQLLQTLETQRDVSLQTITELRNCKEYDKLFEYQQILSSNLEKIYNFLLDNATNGNMPKEMVEILRRLGQQSIDTMNAFLVRTVCDVLAASVIGEYVHSNPVIMNFAALNVHPHLVTLGDVLYLLNEMEQAGSELGIRQFTMVVKMIYSITMIRLLFAQGIEPQYLAASQLLGSTICNPAIQLLPANTGNLSYEWMPHVRGERIAVKIGDELYPLDGKKVDNTVNNIESKGYKQGWDVLSITTAVRMSFFVLGYHRMKRTGEFRQIDPHVYDPGDYPLVKYRRSSADDINSALLAFHWMSFISLALNPGNTVDAMFHYLKGTHFFEAEEYKGLMDRIEDWRKKYVSAVPIYSMDILNELVYDMHEKRFGHDDGTAEDQRLHGYICFIKSLKASLEDVLKRTYIKEKQERADDSQKDGSEKDNPEINILKSCPILFELQNEAGDNTQIRKLEEELKWLYE